MLKLLKRISGLQRCSEEDLKEVAEGSELEPVTINCFDDQYPRKRNSSRLADSDRAVKPMLSTAPAPLQNDSKVSRHGEFPLIAY